MRIVWDEPKRQQNIKDHGFDFALAIEFDWVRAIVKQTYPSSTGRARFIATGLLRGDLFTIVFSPLGREAISVISLRRASRRERKIYEQEKS
jgi:uncharacterized DUF497 family protein